MPECKWCPLPMERDEMDSYWRHRLPNGTTTMYCAGLAPHVATPMDNNSPVKK